MGNWESDDDTLFCSMVLVSEGPPSNGRLLLDVGIEIEFCVGYLNVTLAVFRVQAL